MELPFLFTLLFIFFFVSGGISGMAVAHTGMDILFHDSFYVVGHFHVILPDLQCLPPLELSTFTSLLFLVVNTVESEDTYIVFIIYLVN